MKKLAFKLLTLILVVSTALFIGTACKQEGGDSNATHVHEFSETVISPTCTMQGYTICKCSCGEEFKDSYVNAIGHISTPAVKENEVLATCTKGGSYDSVVYCNVCGADYSRTKINTSKLNHDFVTYVSDGNATCTVDGTKTAKCENCEETDTITDKNSKLNHEFVNYISDNNATESADGTKTATCERAGCNETDTIIDVGSKLETTGLTFKTLTVNELNVSGKVSNATTKFNFNNEIITNENYIVALNSNGTNQVLTKEVDLVAGDNVVYVFLMKGYNIDKIYTVTIRRTPTYLVSFATGIDGVTVPSQTIEEGSFATKPNDLSIGGYEFLGYDFDFNTPITQNVTINVKIEAIFTHSNGTITGLTDCGKTLSEIIIPVSINGTVITSIGKRVFYNCDSLTSIKIPNSVTSIGDNAFYSCSRLTKVNYTGSIDNWVQIEFAGNSANPIYYTENLYINNELVTNAVISTATKINDDAFCNCRSLTNVTIGNSVTSIGGYAFEYCDSLTSIKIPNSVTRIGNSAFYNTGIYKNEDNWENGVLYIGNWLIEAKDTISGAYTIKEGTVGIADGAFAWCASLTSIEIPNSVTSIGKEAFSNCDNLTSVTIGNSVTSIGEYAFYYCRSLTSVTIGNSVTSIGEYAFYYCPIEIATIPTIAIGSMPKTNLKTVVINGGASIGYRAFDNVRSLTNVTIGNSVTSIGGYAFYDCYSLTSIKIPNSVTSIGWAAFFNCDSLTKVNYTGSIDEWVQIEFDESSSNPLYHAKNLYINNELVTNAVISTATKINAYAFYNCYNLTSIEIPNSVTTIGDYAFYRCYRLTSIEIPNSVTSIGNYAFEDCDSLTSITFSDTSTWYRTTDSSYFENKTYGTETDVTNATNNATYFKTTYDDYYWYKK